MRNRKPLFALFMVLALAASLAVAQGHGPVDFSLRSIDGQTVTADSLRGEVVELAFGASWLPLSRKQVQCVRKLADNYAKRGVVVFWRSQESESPKSKNYASEEQLSQFSLKTD